MLNIQTNWEIGDISPTKLSRFYASISTMIDIGDLFKPSSRVSKNHSSTSYRIKAMVMFTGNHYFFTVREEAKKGQKVWVEYNDERNPRKLPDLTEVIFSNIEINARPTLIVYERAT